jgi:hypothetical protein
VKPYSEVFFRNLEHKTTAAAADNDDSTNEHGGKKKKRVSVRRPNSERQLPPPVHKLSEEKNELSGFTRSYTDVSSPRDITFVDPTNFSKKTATKRNQNLYKICSIGNAVMYTITPTNQYLLLICLCFFFY